MKPSRWFWGRYTAMRLEISQKDWLGRLIRGDDLAWERTSEIMANEQNLHFESTGMSVDDLDKAMRIASAHLVEWATPTGTHLRLP